MRAGLLTVFSRSMRSSRVSDGHAHCPQFTSTGPLLQQLQEAFAAGARSRLRLPAPSRSDAALHGDVLNLRLQQLGGSPYGPHATRPAMASTVRLESTSGMRSRIIGQVGIMTPIVGSCTVRLSPTRQYADCWVPASNLVQTLFAASAVDAAARHSLIGRPVLDLLAQESRDLLRIGATGSVRVKQQGCGADRFDLVEAVAAGIRPPCFAETLDQVPTRQALCRNCTPSVRPRLDLVSQSAALPLIATSCSLPTKLLDILDLGRTRATRAKAFRRRRTSRGEISALRNSRRFDASSPLLHWI